MNCQVCGCYCDNIICEDCAVEVEEGVCRCCGENPVSIGDLCGQCFWDNRVSNSAIENENAECDPFDGILY